MEVSYLKILLLGIAGLSTGKLFIHMDMDSSPINTSSLSKIGEDSMGRRVHC